MESSFCLFWPEAHALFSLDKRLSDVILQVAEAWGGLGIRRKPLATFELGPARQVCFEVQLPQRADMIVEDLDAAAMPGPVAKVEDAHDGLRGLQADGCSHGGQRRG